MCIKIKSKKVFLNKVLFKNQSEEGNFIFLQRETLENVST